ncbi:acyl-CoA thioesterase [Corynebacterium sp. 320]|uniref:acyl-CoA thioesterase n=1 Tax=Corynebacterium TaxID=1716 RepID=UPI00125CB8F9|nr:MULTISPECIES: hotdog domain-containing protein [Corynebacterium]KAB1503005.1 acyl-CoA thioesterase [Corynebacterium sp. 320]KAB1550785.1 acyl-CoA thioesterase [Corynebacterium sp. 321]KAB1551142.1 acyl-CoA thioesterase [Corynebacterium sp. 319]KAB3526802.1 acyl-CoA thioesterase [Corynebacterium sp. 250]KAB3538296.1 acyl-CoA thioesterase [Corynebacterium sp. 366]
MTDTPNPAVTLRFLAAPTDVLMAGAMGVHGGRVLEWIDKAAYACATGWARSYCVTAYVGHIHFTRPIPSGHMVEVRSRIVYTGRSSMHIVNEVLSADPREGVFTRACDCLVIFVAMDENRKPKPVPTFTPTTEEEIRKERAALSRVQLRREIEEEMLRQNYTDNSTAPRVTHRFLAKPTDVNWGGNVHGGTAMQWIDEAATNVTMSWSGERTVAVYAGGIRFYRPVQIGDLVEVDARLIRTDARSMTVMVHLRAGDPREQIDELPTAIHASMTYVATDIDGNPLAAREYTPITDEDKALALHATTLRQLRKEYEPIPLVEPTPLDFKFLAE